MGAACPYDLPNQTLPDWGESSGDYSVFIRRGSRYPTAELVFGSFQDPGGYDKVDRIMHSIGISLQDAAMERAHSVIGRNLCKVTDSCHLEVRMYYLPMVRDSAANQQHRMTCEQPCPYKY